MPCSHLRKSTDWEYAGSRPATERMVSTTKSLRMRHLGGSKLESEDGYVVFLAKLLRGLRYGFGGVARDGGGAVEAEESSVLIARFYDAIGEEGELGFGGELEGAFGVR